MPQRILASLKSLVNNGKYLIELPFSLHKCPKPSWQGFRPLQTGIAQMPSAFFLNGASLSFAANKLSLTNSVRINQLRASQILQLTHLGNESSTKEAYFWRKYLSSNVVGGIFCKKEEDKNWHTVRLTIGGDHSPWPDRNSL